MMRELKLKGDYITLGQLLKAESLVSDGVEAKARIKARFSDMPGDRVIDFFKKSLKLSNY